MARPRRDGSEAVMSWEEIGQVIGCSRQNAEAIGRRALEKCRAHLADQGVLGWNTLDVPDDVDRPDCRVSPPPCDI